MDEKKFYRWKKRSIKIKKHSIKMKKRSSIDVSHCDITML